MIPDVSVEVVGVENLLRDIEEMGGKKMAVNIRESTGLLGRVCAERTQPVVDESGGAISAESQSISGASPEAKKMGQAAVIRDISRVYRAASSIFKEVRDQVSPEAAKGFYAMVKDGRYAEAEQFLRKLGVRVSSMQVQAWDSGKRHQQMRTNRGRINKGVRPTIVDDVKSLQAYMTQKKNLVGYTKSSWINAARQIPGAKGVTRGVPAWVKNQRGPGYGIDGTRSGKDPFVQLVSTVPWIGKVIGARQTGNALKGFDAIMGKNLLQQANYLRQKHRRLLAA